METYKESVEVARKALKVARDAAKGKRNPQCREVKRRKKAEEELEGARKDLEEVKKTLAKRKQAYNRANEALRLAINPGRREGGLVGVRELLRDANVMLEMPKQVTHGLARWKGCGRIFSVKLHRAKHPYWSGKRVSEIDGLEGDDVPFYPPLYGITATNLNTGAGKSFQLRLLLAAPLGYPGELERYVVPSSKKRPYSNPTPFLDRFWRRGRPIRPNRS